MDDDIAAPGQGNDDGEDAGTEEKEVDPDMLEDTFDDVDSL